MQSMKGVSECVSVGRAGKGKGRSWISGRLPGRGDLGLTWDFVLGEWKLGLLLKYRAQVHRLQG